MNACKRCYVSGKVQGVFFRASARSRAEALRVTGYAKNLDDGRVEVLACGEPANVEALISWLWEGPRGARVDDVHVQDAEAVPPHDFKTC